MKILLVSPCYPDSFWSFKHALKIISRKALNPPLGMLTIAAMLPKEWQKRAVDMNVNDLKDEDIKWADYVFISAMIVQRKSAEQLITRVKKLGKKIVAGGPLFTTGHTLINCDEIDHVVLNEGEVTLPLLLKDLENGCAKHIYKTDKHPSLTETPVPMWSLIDLNKYGSIPIQYSRGCPFNCEFCDIIIMDGRIPRTKSKEQMLAELQVLYDQGYRSTVFIVDDNFIGNKKKLKKEILPAMIAWQKEHGHPFTFLTEASINLADDEELMELMSQAGFDRVFVGIETPHEDSLIECNKYANTKRDLVDSVKHLQRYGFEVMGGFIVGFDSDPISIFERQISFIQKSGICTALINLLNAPLETRLWHRLEKENRLLNDMVGGESEDGTINFIPKMNLRVLVEGYKRIVRTIYSPKEYYERIQIFFKEYQPRQTKRHQKIDLSNLKALAKSMIELGIKDTFRVYFWRLLISCIIKYPQRIGLAINLSAQGLHFRKIYDRISRIEVDDALLVRQEKVLNGEPV